MTAENLKNELLAARAELADAAAALAPKHKGGEWERFGSAQARCIALERELARALGEPCAVEISWPERWSTGAPLPHVISSGSTTRLVYHLSERVPGWDGSTASMIDPSTSDRRPIAIVEFQRCRLHKFGSPNDEALQGHPLSGRGLVPYAAHLVERSPWIAELMTINSVHRHYRPDAWHNCRHYLLPFHDQTFECIADGHTIKTTRSSFAEAVTLCANEIVR